MSEANTTNNQPKVKTPEDQLADKLCTISLICYFGAPILSTILSTISSTASDLTSSFSSSNVNSALSSAIFWPIGLVLALGPLAGIILMVIARIKAPKNTFGKILMWIYIGLFILKLLLALLLLVWFGAAIVACASRLN